MNTATAEQTETFDEALTRFVESTQSGIDAHYAKNLDNLRPSELTIDPRGKKYVRIVVITDAGAGQRSVFCFIQKVEGGKFPVGSVLFSASWKAPALNHARGTIFGDAKGYGVGVYGADYIR